MAIEIERKFLVISDKLPALENGTLYRQGYLSLMPHIRYRMIDNRTIITIKQSIEGEGTRHEWEFENTLTPEEQASLTPLAVRKPIEKIRYKIPHQGLIWEIDVYQGENLGLITADVELPSTNHSINFPEWIDQTAEIGGDPKYFNVNLGENPYSTWK